MSTRNYQQALYHAFVDAGLTTWLSRLPDQLARGLDRQRFGDLPQWEKAVHKLPTPGGECHVELNADTVAIDAGMSDADRRRSRSLLALLAPWRKGPYRIDDIDIDTEWRSDWKWQRVAPHLSPLKGRRILDVGGGNGYHGWRMAGAGAGLVIVVDPSPRFYWQFLAMRHFIGSAPPVHFVPVGLEDVPPELEYFDTVFSMGVLYHRRSPIDHLLALRDTLRPGGELVLETLVVEGDEHTLLMPGDRYARMPNVWFLPSSAALSHWCRRCGFEDVKVVDEAPTTLDEQRATEWMTFQSLRDFLDPDDPTRTVEGYPAPRRAVLIARRR